MLAPMRPSPIIPSCIAKAPFPGPEGSEARPPHSAAASSRLFASIDCMSSFHDLSNASAPSR